MLGGKLTATHFKYAGDHWQLELSGHPHCKNPPIEAYNCHHIAHVI